MDQKLEESSHFLAADNKTLSFVSKATAVTADMIFYRTTRLDRHLDKWIILKTWARGTAT